MTEDVERIVRVLSMGQKDVLRRVNETSDGRVLVPSLLGNLNASVGWPKGLISYYSAYYSRLTPLGLAIRQHLLSTPLQQDSQP